MATIALLFFLPSSKETKASHLLLLATTYHLLADNADHLTGDFQDLVKEMLPSDQGRAFTASISCCLFCVDLC